MGVRRLSIWVRVERICSMNGVDLGSRKASHLGTRRQVRFVVDSRLCRSFLPSRCSHRDSRMCTFRRGCSVVAHTPPHKLRWLLYNTSGLVCPKRCVVCTLLRITLVLVHGPSKKQARCATRSVYVLSIGYRSGA